MFDRMSLIHLSDDSSKTVRDGDFFIEPFRRIQNELTFHTYSICLAPNIHLLGDEKLEVFTKFYAFLIFKKFILCPCFVVIIQNNLTRMPVSLCKVKTVITSTVFEIIERGIREVSEKMLNRMSLIHSADDSSKTVRDREFFMKQF
jgi:hypothetical protein